MKRLMLVLVVMALGGMAAVAMAGDFHVGANLVCSDCHVAHYSQSHDYVVGGTVFPPLGPSGPYNDLLRNNVNDLCLSCHDGKSWAPDVFGANTGGTIRQGGALNSDPLYGRTNDAGYDVIDGHSLGSKANPPGMGTSTYVPAADGLVCTSCHAQHGSATQYRNLLNRGVFNGDTLSYAISSNDLTKDVFERSPAAYGIGDVDFNEPNTHGSDYGRWCGSCHQLFHGAGGSSNMGSVAGGTGSANANPWHRHPDSDVNIGASGASATFISSLSQFNGLTNNVKVMDPTGKWDHSSNQVTPSCFSCHKGHGNKNPFALIYMSGTGTVGEEGDGGQYRDLCRQCHSEGG
jgi:hypothetical protein